MNVISVNTKGLRMLASELWAISQGKTCKGSEECHWCGGPCDKTWPHDDPFPIPFSRTRSTAVKPSGIWICIGCWLFRRPSITVQFSDKNLKDRQSPIKHSWWIDDIQAIALRNGNEPKIYDKLLKPPARFTLSFIREATDNHIHLAKANSFQEVKASDPIWFTIDNRPHFYTIYELENAIKSGPDGREPGVRLLMEVLGPPLVKEEVKKEVGRPVVDYDARNPQRPIPLQPVTVKNGKCR